MKHLSVVSKDAPAKAASGPIWAWPVSFKTSQGNTSTWEINQENGDVVNVVTPIASAKEAFLG